MAKKKIAPVMTITRGQCKAIITAIDYKAEDCFIGEIEVEIGDKNFEWNINGICRDSKDIFNLNCQEPEIKSLIEMIETHIQGQK